MVHSPRVLSAEIKVAHSTENTTGMSLMSNRASIPDLGSPLLSVPLGKSCTLHRESVVDLGAPNPPENPAGKSCMPITNIVKRILPHESPLPEPAIDLVDAQDVLDAIESQDLEQFKVRVEGKETDKLLGAALMKAALFGSFSIVEYLVNKYCLEANYNGDALVFAVGSGRNEIVEFLLQKINIFNCYLKVAVLKSANVGDVDIFNKLLEIVLKRGLFDCLGKALEIAARKGHQDICERLLPIESISPNDCDDAFLSSVRFGSSLKVVEIFLRMNKVSDKALHEAYLAAIAARKLDVLKSICYTGRIQQESLDGEYLNATQTQQQEIADVLGPLLYPCQHQK